MKQRKHGWKGFMAAALSLLLAISAWPGNALAAERIDLQKTASLSVQYQSSQDNGGQAMANVAFQLYQVAQVSASLQYTLTDDFAGYAVSLDKLDSDGWRSTAQTLAAYAAADKLTPVQQAVTDKNGRLTFSDLPVGLYLVVGQKHSQNGSTYLPAPFLVCLPNLDETQSWEYHPVVSPKYSQITPPGGDGPSGSNTLQREVVKVWSDGGNTASRPQAVTVQLLQDGAVYDTVTLSATDNWRHSWSGLSADFIWQVVERNVPDGYTVRCALEGSTFVVTNTASADGAPPADSDEPVQPSASTEPEDLIDKEPAPEERPDRPDVSPSDNSNEDDYILLPPVEAPAVSLPQTGQLWWPVPVLAASGLLLFLLGWVKQQKSRRSA